MESLKNQQLDIDSILSGVGTAEDVKEVLKDKEKLLMRKPFTRGGRFMPFVKIPSPVRLGGSTRAQTSAIKKSIISQDQYIAELDPYMHSVLFDENIPSICVKTVESNVMEMRFLKTALPMQQIIMEKQTLHMACQPMKFTLSEKKPTDKQQANFVTFKEYWDLRNQDGMKIKMVATAKSFGDAGLLYYHDRHGEIKSRIISYEDGYVICSHNDANGDRMLEAVYYVDSYGRESIDCWDDKACYRFTTDDTGNYELIVEPHGFGEIPLITKRTKVAWDNGQTLIEGYERTYNIFQVLQNKYGWGLLYVKGRIDPKAKKLAGNIVVNDVSYEGKGDMKFLEPPSPQNTIETLKNVFNQIQISTGTTFILPADIHSSSDTSGVAVQMTQSLDIQTAKNGIAEWQNVADKMVRLFKRGLAIELVQKGINPTAITDFDSLRINAQFDIWKPFSETEYNNMLSAMKNSGIISRKTSIEQNTISRPDELERIIEEEQSSLADELSKMEKVAEVNAKIASQSDNDTKTED